MKRTFNRGDIALKVFIVFIIVLGLCGVGLGISSAPQVRFAESPEQSEHVEVTGKRITKSGSGGKGNYTFTYTFIVAFKFSDGSEREFKIDSHATRHGKEEVNCSLYDSIYEGDEGILIYKEFKNIDEEYKNEDTRFHGRFFVSFERDSEYGELKIVSQEQYIEPWQFVLMGAVVFVGILMAVFAFFVDESTTKKIIRKIFPRGVKRKKRFKRRK